MATAKKNLYLASEVDLPSGGKPEKPGDPKPTKRVGPGILSELELSDEEIKGLPRSVIRPATADEIENAEQRAKAAEARKVLTDAEQERRDAEIERENERKAVIAAAEKAKAEDVAKLDEAHAADRAKAAESTTTKLNEAQGTASTKGTKK